jgi:glycosyltransferase involved in cell wall biosynthesis
MPEANGKLRFAWVEEWMSSLAVEMLPYLARRHEVTYVTAGDAIPQADFARVVRGKRWKYMNLAGFELSRKVNALYRAGTIDGAVVWASIGFGLRGVPFVNLEGGSVWAEIQMFRSRIPRYRRIRFLPGFVHYVVPEMLCNRRAARVVVPSTGLKEDLMRLHHLPDDRVAVVYHGVEPVHLALYPRKPRDLPPKILFLGRLHFRKGIAPVLREFVRRPDIGAEFLIVGDGPDRAEMEASAAGDARVRFLGTVGRDRLQEVLLTTNVFVFPTFYEGFGLALTEAMASGHACVAYDIPVVREVLGDCGLYARTGDAAGIVDHLAHLVARPDDIERHAARGHERAKKFSWDDARTDLERIIADAIGGVSARRPLGVGR